MTPRILIIAGSDASGGAGIQADIKTVTMLGGHAMTAITAITAQNTLGVQAVHPVPTEMVVAQMRSCIDDIGVDAVKIGMIGSAATAHSVADVLEGLDATTNYPGEGRGPVSQICVGEDAPHELRSLQLDTGLRRGGARDRIPIVFDPVMVATSGSVLADADTIAAFGRLMALATVVTPNLPEARALGGVEAICAYGCDVLLKGGHGQGDRIVDELVTRAGDRKRWDGNRIDTPHTHGTGCTLASAIATGLGERRSMEVSVERAIRFVRIALERAPGLGHGHGPMGQQFATGFQCPD